MMLSRRTQDLPKPPIKLGSIRFSSLGLVVVDEIHYPLRETIRDVVGGSGTYSMFSVIPRAFFGRTNSNISRHSRRPLIPEFEYIAIDRVDNQDGRRLPYDYSLESGNMEDNSQHHHRAR